MSSAHGEGGHHDDPSDLAHPRIEFEESYDGPIYRGGTDPTGGAGTMEIVSHTAGPKVFISYSHTDKAVAQELDSALESAGCKVWIDDKELAVGDSLIERIATAIDEAEFFVVLVSATSVESDWCRKELSLALTDEITSRVGLKVLPVRVGDVEMPAGLKDKLYLPINPDDVAATARRLADDMRRRTDGDRDREGPARTPRGPTRKPRSPRLMNDWGPEGEAESIRIEGIVEEGIGMPTNDGSRGSALYRVPLQLSRRPTARWADLFRLNWDRPPAMTTMHRPGIGSVVADTIVLDGTTIEELEKYHVETLKLVVETTNEQHRALVEKDRRVAEEKRAAEHSHKDAVREGAKRIKFD